MQPHYWNDATRHLAKQCPAIKQLIARYQGETLSARGDGFYTLLRSVVGQQISVKAADAVWAKVEKAVKPLAPKKLLSLSDEKLRACGLSASKVAYARNVAEFFVAKGIVIHTHGSEAQGVVPLPLGERPGEGASKLGAQSQHTFTQPSPPRGGGLAAPPIMHESFYWNALSDAQVIAELTSIKGIGTWTAEMFLIFHLMRPDVFPVKDLGVLKAINLHLLTGDKRLVKDKWLKPKEYEAIAARWSPYRTVATWYLWRALDPVPVAY